MYNHHATVIVITPTILGLIWVLGCTFCVKFASLNKLLSAERFHISSGHMKRASTRLDPILVPKSNSRLFVNVTTLHPTCDRGPAYVVRTNYPWKIVMPPQGGDKAATTRKSKNENYLGGRLSQNSTNFPLSTTLSQSKYYHCDILAVNGGPFGKDGFSTGPTVVEKKLVRTHNDSLDSSFVGIGNSLDSKWVMGTYRDIMQMNGRDSRSLLDYFVTGFGWLVYNSQIVASNAQNPTGADRAPRTAFGLDRESNMLLAVVDGCELW
jgi:hypothetical protein